jgi:type I restriction enzyme S subunit
VSVEWVPVGAVMAPADVEEVVDPEKTYPIMGVLGHGRGVLVRDPIKGADTSYKSLRRMQAGQVVYSRLKAFEGAFAVVPKLAEGMYSSHEFPSFDADKNRLDVDWFSHLLHTRWFQDQVRGLSKGIGARRERLDVNRFCSIKIPLPDLPTQQAIAARLDRVAERQSLIGGAAVSRADGAALGPRVVAQALESADLPSVRLGDLYDTVSDVVHPGEDLGEAKRFVGLEHMMPHVGVRTGESRIDDLKGRKLRFAKGDVLYGYLRPYLNKVWVADGPGLCSVEQYVLRPKEGVGARLLAHVLRQQATLNAVNAATHRLQLPRIRIGLLGAIDVPDVRRASEDLADQLDRINDCAARLAALARRFDELHRSLLSSARNEEVRRLLDR